MICLIRLFVVYSYLGYVLKYVHSAVPCWSFATCGDVLPRVQVSVEEHTGVGEVIFQASAYDPDGAGIWFYSLVQYNKPFPEWTCLSFSLEGKFEVTDSTALDYESLTDGNPASAPHAIIDIDAWDYDFETTYDQQDALVEITILDVPEMPVFTSLPTGIALSESQQVEEEIFQANYTDPDIYLGETYVFGMTTTPDPSPFRIDESDGRVTHNPCFDSYTTPVYELNISLSDGTFVISELLTVTIVDTANAAPVLENLPNSVNVSEDADNGSVVYTARASDANPCDVITYTLITTAMPFVMDSSTGDIILTGTLDYESVTSYELSITASDGLSTSIQQTLSIQVLDVLEYPFLSALQDNISIFENSSGNEMLSYLSFSDSTVNHVLTVTPSGPFSIDVYNSTAAKILLDPNPLLNFEDIFMYDVTATVSDGTLSTSVNLTVNILDVNESPAFINLPNITTVVETFEYSDVLFRVKYVDEDIADHVTVGLNSTVPHDDIFNCSPEGVISVKPGTFFDYESVTEYNLTINITDSGGLVISDMFTIRVNNINERPIILGLPKDVYISENSEGDVNITSVTASDPEGDDLSYNLTDMFPSQVPVDITLTGIITILPSPNFNHDVIDIYNFTVQVTDGHLTSNMTVSLHIIDENRPPQLINVTNISVFENETTSRRLYTMQFIDADINDNWTFAIEKVAPPVSLFFCDPLKGYISFVDNPSFNYEEVKGYELNISVTDSTGLKDFQILEVDVMDVDEVPLLTGIPYIQIQFANNMTIYMLHYIFSHNPNEVKPNVTVINETETSEKTLFSIHFFDPENSSITPYISVNPSGPFLLTIFNASVAEIVLTVNPRLDFENTSTYNISISISDGQHHVSSQVTVMILDVAEAPSFTNLPNVTFVQEASFPNGGYIFTVEYVDNDFNDSISVSLINVVPGVSVFACSSKGVITVHPNITFDYEVEQEFNLTVELKDIFGLSVASLLTVYITDMDEKPVILNLPSYGNISEDVVGSANITTILAFDPEGQVLTFNITNKENDGTTLYISSEGVISTSSEAYFNYDIVKMYNVTIEVSDGFLSTTSYYILHVTDEDRAPAFVNSSQDIYIMENETNSRVIHALEYYDKDISENWTLAIEIKQPPTCAFQIDGLMGGLSFVSNPGFDFEAVDFYSLNVSVTDSTGLKDYQQITIHIEDINESPHITNLPPTPIIVDEDDPGGKILYNVTCEDPENDRITFTINLHPHGPFVINDVGEIRINNNPQLNFETIPSYNVTVICKDNQTLSDSGFLGVTVGDINEAPVLDITQNAINIPENRTGRTLLLNVSAIEEDNGDVIVFNITYIIPSDTDVLFSINAQSGEFWLEQNASLDYEWQPQYIVTVRVTDANGLWDERNITVNILDVNETPQILNLPGNISIYDGSPLNEPVFEVNATDPECDLLVYSIGSSDPTDAPFVINNTGSISLRNNTLLDHFRVSMYTLHVSVSDGYLSTTNMLTVNVLNTPDPPVFINLDNNLSVGESTLGNIAQYMFSDSDRDHVTLTMNVIGQMANSPFVLSGLGVLAVEAPGLNFEDTSLYTLNITLTDATGLKTSSTINVTVLDENEPPTCTINNTDVRIVEELPVGTVIDAGIFCSDVDTSDQLLFNLTGDGVLYVTLLSHGHEHIVIYNRIDRDLPSNKTRINVALTARDRGGLQDIVNVSFRITDVNDNVPEFDVMTLNASLPDGTLNGTLVSQVIANDLDDGVNGDIFYEEISSSNYLSIDTRGRIYLTLQLDYEQQNVIEYQIQARDAGIPQLSSTATFTLFVQKANEEVPEFEKDFYNWEIYSDATTGVKVGKVKAQNVKKKLYTFEVNHQEFSVEQDTGEVSVRSELQDGQKYVLYVSAEVTGKPAKTIVRIDAYDKSTYLIDFEFEERLTTFDQLYVIGFKALIAQIIPGCKPRVVFINKEPWLEYAYFNVSSSRRRLFNEMTTLTLLIVKNNVTDSFSNLDSEKEFYTVTTLLQYLTSDGDGTPNEYFKSDIFSEYQIVSIKPHTEATEDVEVNWWTETKEGLITTAMLGLVGLLLLGFLLLIICILCKRKRDQQKKRLFEPSKIDKSKRSGISDETLNVEDLHDIPDRPSYTKMSIRSSLASWEALPSSEIICKTPHLADSVNKNIDGYPIFSKIPTSSPGRPKQTKLHSLSEMLPDMSDRGSPDVGYNSSRTVTPLSDAQSMSDCEVLSLKSLRASVVSPVFRQQHKNVKNSPLQWEQPL